MPLRRFIILLTLAVVFILVITIWLLPPDEDFRVDNPSWNGSSELNSEYSFVPLDSLDELPDEPVGATLILVPYLALSSYEQDEIGNFVLGGGTLVLADDYGHGNEVLEYLGMTARFSGYDFLDPLFNYKNERLPRVFNLSSDSVTQDTGSIVLNHATCLTGVDETNMLALSSAFSYLDVNNNQEWDEDEPTGPLPVISSHVLGEGQVILVSDPSIFINSMEELGDNYDIIENIAGISSSRLFIDQSHLPYSDLRHTKDLLAVVRNALTTQVGTLVLVAVLLIITLRPFWSRKGDIVGDTI